MPDPRELALQAAERVARRIQRERDEQVHRKLQQAAHFFGAFAARMNLDAPPARQVLELPGVVRFSDLALRDLFVEERMEQAHDLSGTISGSDARHYEYVLLSYHYIGTRRHTAERMIAPEIERLEDLLAVHRIRYDVKLARNTRAQVERATFTIESDVAAGVKFIPDYERARVRIALRNVDRLGAWEAVLPATKLSQPLFEEIARCVLGEPNEFRRMVLGGS